ncbi:uncharacterized protein LOC125544969 isoform X2 [Triticum urartu]|uniref:uncharacterized protein LOC125544969 isoform X2 n=1 Tax=Triticum urartu TaxID=4572 RepID=UPI0020448059|nr:uncharacterized protein LOC125544969 isoform X2 [Triticum urartu]
MSIHFPQQPPPRVTRSRAPPRRSYHPAPASPGEARSRAARPPLNRSLVTGAHRHGSLGSSSSAAIYDGAKLDPERRHPAGAPRHRICAAPPRICPSTLLRAPSAIASFTCLLHRRGGAAPRPVRLLSRLWSDVCIRSNQDIRADECAVGIAQMTVKEGRQLSIVAEADELDSSNGSTEQHVSTVLDAEHGSKSWTPNLIDVERENRGWVRRHRHGWGGRVGGSAGDALSQLACVWGSVQV